MRRMYGELQEPRTVTKTTFTIVRSFGHTRYCVWEVRSVVITVLLFHSFVAAPLIQGQFASTPKLQR